MAPAPSLVAQRSARSGRRLRVSAARTALAALAAGALALAPLTAGAVADERSDAVEQQQEAQQKQAELTASLEGVSAELGKAYLALEAAKASLATAEKELTAAEAVLAAKVREQQAAADRLAVAEADLAQLTAQAEASKKNAEENSAEIADLVVSTYQGDSSITSWTYVLASISVDDLTERASTMEIASGVQESVLAKAEEQRAQDANRQARQDATTKRVTTLKQEADAAATAAAEAKDAASAKRDEVATLTAARESAANELEKEKAGLEAQQAQAAKDEAAAAAAIAKIDAANRASALYTGGSGSVAVSALGSGAIGHPITGSLVVASPYGYRIHPITGVLKLHAGVDFVASQGTPQYAAVSGRVTYNQNSSCGNGIFIDGGVINGQSVVIAYCHLSAYSVANGATVSKGDQIGLTGMTGGATGPHVHFEVWINGSTIDPMTLPGF